MMLLVLAQQEIDTEFWLQLGMVLLTFIGIFFWWLRGRGKAKSPSAGAADRPPSKPDPAKDAALEKFKNAHAKARNNLSKVQDGIENDPQRATKAFRNLMKR